MTNTPEFSQYVEALTVLATVNDRRRDALRKAVESAAAAESQAKSKIVDQQRMYARAARDIDAAERALAELRSVGGFPSGPVPTAERASLANAPPLATIRGTVAEVATWATDIKPVLASLLRSRDRLAQTPAQSPVNLVPPPASKQRAMGPIWAAGGVAAVVIVIIIVLVASSM